MSKDRSGSDSGPRAGRPWAYEFIGLSIGGLVVSMTTTVAATGLAKFGDVLDRVSIAVVSVLALTLLGSVTTFAVATVGSRGGRLRDQLSQLEQEADRYLVERAEDLSAHPDETTPRSSVIE